MKTIHLRSGYSIPVLGLGTWLLTGKECFNAVITALENGYTHIDTAAAYENEDDIGQAIVESDIERSRLFITSKVWYQKLRYNDVLDQCNRSLEKLQTEYLDLLLIHWPNKFIPISETFEAFEQLVEERKIRSVGVSNFTIGHLENAMKSTVLPISVNQVEFHPLLNQNELLAFCRKHEICLTAYSPLAHGNVFHSELIKEIAFTKETGPAQIVLAWIIQKGIVAVPKASSEEHIRANMEAVSIILSEEEMAAIDGMEKQKRISNPSWAEFD